MRFSNENSQSRPFISLRYAIHCPHLISLHAIHYHHHISLFRWSQVNKGRIPSFSLFRFILAGRSEGDNPYICRCQKRRKDKKEERRRENSNRKQNQTRKPAPNISNMLPKPYPKHLTKRTPQRPPKEVSSLAINHLTYIHPPNPHTVQHGAASTNTNFSSSIHHT